MVTSSPLVAWAFGGPFFSWLSDRVGHRNPLYIIGCAVAFWRGGRRPSIWQAFHWPPASGFSSGSMIISFAIAKESVPGIVNMGVMIGPMVLQPAVGWMLDVKWQGQLRDGVRVYDLTAYQTGFSMMLAWLTVALILLFFTRETRCRQID